MTSVVSAHGTPSLLSIMSFQSLQGISLPLPICPSISWTLVSEEFTKLAVHNVDKPLLYTTQV
jgi:hypothetical protein